MEKTLFIIFLVCILLIFKYLTRSQVEYIEAFEGIKFLVRNLPDKKQASTTLYNIRKQLLLLVNTIVEEMEADKNHPHADKYYAYVKIIQKRLPNSIIKESSYTSKYTSYTVNKGEEIVFCLRSKVNDRMHGMNNLMYVAIHEIAHVGCPEEGHTHLFHQINKFLLIEAQKKGIYKYANYSKEPVEYCGMKLDNNLLDNNILL